MLRLTNIKETFRQGLVLSLLLVISTSITAQNTDVTLPAVGDVPLAGKIQVMADEDDETQAIIQGEAGSVFPNAFVVVQNRYTNDREIVSASSDGDFSTSLYGRNQTPYWVAAFQRFPSDDDINNAMGTTVYGKGDNNTFYVESDLGGNVPRYRIFGEVNTTELIEGENLVISLDVELDIADDLPEVDDLEIRLDLDLRKSTTNRSSPTTLIISKDSINRTETQLTFSAIANFDASFEDRVIPYITAYVRVGDGEWERWEGNGAFGLLGNTSLKDYSVVLPIYIDGINQTQYNTIFLLKLVLELGDTSLDLSKALASQILPPDTYLIQPTLYLKHDDLFGGGNTSGTFKIEVSKASIVLDRLELDIIQGNSRLNDTTIQLVIDSPKLENYPFEVFGNYAISSVATLVINDKEFIAGAGSHGNIRVAETLHLNPTMLNGTPLQVGDQIVRSGYIMPQMPANVQITIIALTTSNRMTYEIDTQANKYGYFSAPSFLVEEVGLYQITYTVDYIDADERLWVAASSLSSSISTVIPNDFTVYGQRGIAGYGGIQQAWFDTTVYPNDDRNAGRQPYFPYYSGDIAYIPDALDSGIYATITSTLNTDDRINYMLSVTSSNGKMRGNSEYFMNEAASLNGDDTFNQQVGMGVDGIRVGDYAFLFGGAWSGDDSAIYGSLMIVEDEDAPARVLSPFMDKLTVFGQEVDMFFVPTGIRPAQVLTLGETLSIVGQVAPTLPTEVTVSVTSPSGKWTQFTDTANAIGYFYSHEHDMELDEIGIWQIDIDTTYHRETSAGQLEKPFPEGNLSYQIYVVPSDNPPLGEAEFMTETTKQNTIHSLAIPDGWTDVRAFATVTTPSWVLSHEELTVFPAGTSYVFNPTQLARDYPNVELMETAEGNHVADVVTLTLAMTGTDANGEPAIRIRTYTILHDVTYSTDGMFDS